MAKNFINIFDFYQARNFILENVSNINVDLGDMLIYKDNEGKEEFSIVKNLTDTVEDEDSFSKESKILRPATLNDSQKFENLLEKGQESLLKCKQLIYTHKLDMQVFQSNYSFDGSRLLFLFTADERIDFRELVKDLAKTFQRQIYLRQIGPRDKAKLIGGYGKCGRTLCCNTFLSKLESISMEMVRIQSLESKGSSKLSGVCGKLLCCLKYEVDAYKDLKKGMPETYDIISLKKDVVAPALEAKVVALDILNSKVKLYFSETEEYLVYNAKDIDKVVRKS